MEITDAQKLELSEFYWETDLSTAEIQRYFSLKKPVNQYVTPLTTEEACPNCSSTMVYRSRTARAAGEKVCTSCKHNSLGIYLCRCSRCKELKALEERKAEKAAYARAVKEYEARRDETATPEYVAWAISKLSRREKIFLKAFVEVVNETEQPTFEEICNRAKVVTYESYLEKLLRVGLACKHPRGSISLNPIVSVEMIEIKNVRNISKSLRFDIFQRDHHTCQYCGRKPTEVTLVVDHLVPVAKGGTDDIDNLITSCEDCNQGKSAKLIEEYTRGYTQEEWREKLRIKRDEALQARRLQLDDLFVYWATCRKNGRVSDYDALFILNLIERFDPSWIKAAIQIASTRSPSNYAKYTAGILRNWAKNGPPESIEDPESSLDQRRATPKQIKYIQELLRKLGLELSDVYPKDKYESLTMLDARDLIGALTSESDEDDEEEAKESKDHSKME